MADNSQAVKNWKAAHRDADLRHKADWRARQRRRDEIVRELVAEDFTTPGGQE